MTNDYPGGGLQSLHDKSFQFANSLPAVKMIASAHMITVTAITTGAYVGGSIKLDVKPLGGVSAASLQKSRPEAARELIFDQKHS